MEGLSFQYPVWFIILCIGLGLGYAILLYFRDKTFREQSPSLNWLLGFLRFFTVTFLSILLLTPFLKSLLTETQKPVVVIAQDASESIQAEMDEEQTSSYAETIRGLASELEGEYELKQYSFGNEIREEIDFEFKDKVTNISEFISGMYDLYSNRNLGAMIIATDGIYNEGSNPIYSNTKFNVPIYTIALGDTTPSRDITLKRVLHNKIAYLGDKFTIQVDVSALNCQGCATNLTVRKVGGTDSGNLHRELIQVESNDHFSTHEVVLEADQSGVVRYRIALGEVEGEASTVNNRRDIYIDVLDAKQKILILANAPHPDLGALRQTLSDNKNYEISLAYAKDYQGPIEENDFVILHQLPSLNTDAGNIITKLKEKSIPHLYIIGNQSNIPRLNRLQDLINISSPSQNTNEVQAVVANDFVAFTIDDQLRSELGNFAPLTAPFGEFYPTGNAQVLLYQKIGQIQTQYPLLVVGEQDRTRQGVLCAEGIWKWRLYDFLQNENHEIFDELIGKTVQYLSVKEDKRKFRVSLSEVIFSESENIVFDGQLYNDNYELINDPDVSLTISDSDGKDYNFTFDKTENAYRLDAGTFSEGNYTFRAITFSNGEEFTYNGQFSVEPIQLEIYETTADHRLLRLLSDKYGGQLVYPGEASSIAGLLKEKGNVKPVIYQTTKTQPLINLKWMFFLLLILLSTEWFLRRYFGGY